MSIFWFVTFILLLLLEIVTIHFVSIWFSIGAIFSYFVSLVVDDIFIQGAVFVGVSIVSLLATKPIIQKMKHREVVATNLDRVIGEKGLVLREIKSYHPGEVLVLGSVWTAVSDIAISQDVEVVIDHIEGVKVFVRTID